MQASGITNAVAVASGAFYSLALKNDGTVWGWGENDKGQLGNGTFSNTNIPVQVVSSGGAAFSGVVAIAGGTNHTLALKERWNGLVLGRRQLWPIGQQHRPGFAAITIII